MWRETATLWSCCNMCIQRETRILTKLLTVLLNYGSTAHRIQSTKMWSVYKWESNEYTRKTEHVRVEHNAMYRLVGVRSFVWRSVSVCSFVCLCMYCVSIVDDLRAERLPLWVCACVTETIVISPLLCTKSTVSSLSSPLLPLFPSLFIHYMHRTWCVTSCVWFKCKMKEAASFHPYDEAGPIDSVYSAKNEMKRNNRNDCVRILFASAEIFQHIC